MVVMRHNAATLKEMTKAFGGAWLRRTNGNGHKLAVDRVSFDVKPGEIFGVLGPNGSGRLTLIRLIATLLLPDGGQVTIFRHDAVREAMAVRRMINRVSVEAAFFKKLPPMENLVYGARLYGLVATQARAEILRLLGRFGLER
jgi:ABC-2 type transport system ATP-binding protein